ncbi:hypothetical protein HZB97_01905 [Candidatus Gottesmanbacteria bacterium]|nr:hypothetical protein [Candidatus Gottesmanbacteria bacterium]
MNEQASEFTLLIHEITPLGWFAIYCKQAVNPHLSKEERERSRLLANAHLDTAVFLDVFKGQQVVPEEIAKLIVTDRRIGRRKFELLQGLRTVPDKPDPRFDSELATAINTLFPVKPTRRVVSKP